LTSIDRIFCFSTVKNDLKTALMNYKNNINLESASSSEHDFYESNRRLLELCGVSVKKCNDEKKFADIPFKFGPYIVIKPNFATCLTSMK